jgi:cysteine dioxygenase
MTVPSSFPSREVTPMSSEPVQDLLNELDRELDADPRGPGVARILQEYAEQHDDWRRYVHFSSETYTRNLIRASDAYELIVLCWDANQASPIHDHGGMRCWMSVLEGNIRETLFDTPAAEGAVPVQRSRKTLSRGQVAFITDDVGLHEIASEGGRGVSLHLYATPIRSCRTFCPDTGAVQTKVLTYHSIAGELQAAHLP